jgi:phosphatidylglycerol:prolipoprotein diacylglycerol transferase
VHPVLAEVSLGGTQVVVGAYATFLVLAALVAGGLAGRVLCEAGIARRPALAGLAAAVVAGLIGARLLAVVLTPASYAADPGTILAPEPSGFALYGGMAGTGAVVIWLARRWKLDLARLADRLVVPIASGLVLLRIGCFLNGCCNGVTTVLPWGVVFPPGSVAWGQQVIGGGAGALFGRVAPVHPTQLYEAAAVLVLAALAVRLGGRGRPDGVSALFFAAGFLAFRAFNQTLRAPTLDLAVSALVLVEAYAVGALVFAAALAGRMRRGGGPSLARAG